MRGRLLGVFALLSAGASHAEITSEPYAVVGDWKVTANNRGQCAMARFYPGSAKYDDEGLIVAYDAQRKAAALTWVSTKPALPPLGDSLDLELSFLGGKSQNARWGSQAFETEKRADSYGFTHVFIGSTDSERLLSDIGAHETFALFLGPTLMAGLRLNASDAVTKLRECSSKIVGQDASGGLR